jgi:hypothetical protein
MFDSDRSIVGTGRLHFGDLPCIQINDGRETDVLLVLDKAGCAIANRPSGISQEKDDVVFFDTLWIDFEEVGAALLIVGEADLLGQIGGTGLLQDDM